MLLVPFVFAAGLDAAWNTDLVTPAGVDAVCFSGPEGRKRPRSVTFDVGEAGEALRLRWVVLGPVEEPGGVGAVVTVRFADGRELESRPTVGVELATAPGTIRDGEPVVVGVDADGRPVWAVEQTILLGRPTVPVATVGVVTRWTERTICLAGAEVGDAAFASAASPIQDAGYPFAFAGVLDRPPAPPVPAPAGAHGFVTVDPEGHFRYADGERVRFWGVNLVGEAAVPEKADADAFAATLAAYGFNMVRLHHFDRAPRGIVTAGRADPATPLFDADRLDRFDWFVSRLRAHGLYVWAEVATSRELGAADGVADPGGAPNGHKLYPMWEEDWRDAYLAWFRDLWDRANPYTGLRYADDPAVGVLELSNEHSLVLNWGFGIEKLPDVHLARLDARWNDWLRQRYGTDDAVAAAWKGSAHPGLAAGESLGTIAREPRIAALAQAWPDQRRVDLLAFYAELDDRFYRAVEAEAVAIGFHVPFVPSIHYNRPMLQAAFDRFPVADIHVAYDKPADGNVRAVSTLAAPGYPLATTPAAGVGKAMCASELNYPFPNPYRAEAAWLWATLAAVQDWDCLLWFSWADGPLERDLSGLPTSNDVRANPVLAAQMPGAGAAFRNGWIPAAPGLFPVRIDGDSALRQFAFQEGSRPLPPMDVAFVLAHRVRTYLAGTREVAATPGSPAPGVGWWADPGVLLVDRPEVQVRVGPPAGALGDGAGITSLSRLQVALREWAAVSLVALDDRPLAESRSALLTLATTAENTGQRWTAHGGLLRAAGVAPVLVQPARGVVRFLWSGTPEVRPLDGAGNPGEPLPVRRAKGWWVVDPSAVATPWLWVATP